MQALRQLPQLVIIMRKEADGPVAVGAALAEERLEPIWVQPELKGAVAAVAVLQAWADLFRARLWARQGLVQGRVAPPC